MTRKSISRLSGMSAKRAGKIATVSFIASCCNLLWMFFKWMCIGCWFCIKWMCIGCWFCIKWMCIGIAKLCKWSFKGMTKFTKWTFKTGIKVILKIKERRTDTSEM